MYKNQILFTGMYYNNLWTIILQQFDSKSWSNPRFVVFLYS